MIQALVLLLALQDSRPPEFVKFDIARERVGHKVIVEAGLKNSAAAEIAGLKITAIYYDQDRELKRSAAVPVARIAAGATAAFKIEAEQVPNFSRYEVYVEAPSTTYLYHGTDATRLPTVRAATAPRLSLVSHTLSPLTIVVRNGGHAPADEPTAALKFKNASGSVVHQARLRLEKLIAPATEDTFEISLPGLPEHAAVEVSLAWQASDEIAQADPAPGIRDLLLRQCRAVRLTDGSARVSGNLLNNTPGPVHKIAARFQLGKLDAPYELPGIVKAGESRPFVFYIPSCPAFDSMGYSLAYEGAPATAPDGPASPPSSRRTATRRAEADRIALPPPPKQIQEAASNETRPPSVGIRGLLVVEGSYGKGGKYSGDHYLMRMIFLDEKGKPYQPDATVSFSLYDGDKHLKKAQRTITRESWKTEAARVNSQTIDLETTAFDRKTNELWVTIYWTDVPFKKPKADITVELKDVGTYTLKGVEKDWEYAPRWPDGR